MGAKGAKKEEMRWPLPTAPAHARRLDAEALTITRVHGAPKAPPTMCGSTPGAARGRRHSRRNAAPYGTPPTLPTLEGLAAESQVRSRRLTRRPHALSGADKRLNSLLDGNKP